MPKSRFSRRPASVPVCVCAFEGTKIRSPKKRLRKKKFFSSNLALGGCACVCVQSARLLILRKKPQQ